MPSMRTTVTLDKDVVLLLREEMRRSRASFKQTLNTAIRSSLGRQSATAAHAPFAVKARPLGLRPGLDPTSFNKLADELEIEAWMKKPHSRNAK